MSWSYSKLGKYERCPASKRYQYDEKIKVDVEKSPNAQRGSDMHTDLENHLGSEMLVMPEWMRPHIAHLAKLSGGDKEIKLHLDSEWEPVNAEERDLICILDILQFSETGDHALVVDYKSGKRYDNHAEQLELYCLAVLYAHPDVQVAEGTCYYLDEKPGSWSKPVFLARSNMEAVRARWEGRVAMMNADTEGAPRPGWYCKWCDFRNSEGGPCPFG